MKLKPRRYRKSTLTLHEQVLTIEAEMDGKRGSLRRWLVLLEERERLVAAAAREHRPDTHEADERDEPASEDVASDEGGRVGNPISTPDGTGQYDFYAPAESANRVSDQERSNHGQILPDDGRIRADLGAV